MIKRRKKNKKSKKDLKLTIYIVKSIDILFKQKFYICTNIEMQIDDTNIYYFFKT